MDIRTTLFGGSTSFFGEATADAVFAPSVANNVQVNDLIVQSLQRDLDRLNGYRVNLLPSEKEELAYLQEQIALVNERAGPDGLLDSDDVDERTELYQDAYRILGKDYVNVDNDAELSSLLEKVDTLLEPKLQGGNLQRLEQLREMEAYLLADYDSATTSSTTIRQIQNLQTQISELTVPRQISELSNSERADYNNLVNQINEKAGTDLLLNSQDRMKAERLQASIDQLSSS